MFFKKKLKDSLQINFGFQIENVVKHNIKLKFENFYFIDERWEAKGVTDQFLDNALTYNEIYFNRLDFDYLVKKSLTCAEVKLDEKLLILDIGSGGGSSVFSGLKLLPNAQIIATDISPQLLNILGGIAKKENLLGRRVNALCFDLHKEIFKSNIFDLIMGFAILHHLLDPYLASKRTSKIFKNWWKNYFSGTNGGRPFNNAINI